MDKPLCPFLNASCQEDCVAYNDGCTAPALVAPPVPEEEE